MVRWTVKITGHDIALLFGGLHLNNNIINNFAMPFPSPSQNTRSIRVILKSLVGYGECMQCCQSNKKFSLVFQFYHQFTLAVCSSHDRSQVGYVSVMSWSTSSPDSSQAMTSSTNVSSPSADFEASAAWSGSKTYRTRKKDQLKFLFSNPVQKV